MTVTPDYVVIRPALSFPVEFMPKGLDGKWFNLNSMPLFVDTASTDEALTSWAEAKPSGRFEVRDDDGAVAEVWELSFVHD